MKPPTHRDDRDLPADEWQAQERALRAERLGLDPAGDDERMLAYRRIARALMQPLPDPLPADFATQLAHRVGARRALRDWPEHLLGIGLPLALAGSALLLDTRHEVAWWQGLWSGMPAHLLLGPWPLSLAACLGLTVLLDAWQRRRPVARQP